MPYFSPTLQSYKLPDPDELTSSMKQLKKMVDENPELKPPRRLAREKAVKEAKEKETENVESVLLEVENDSQPELPRTDSVPTRVVDTDLEVTSS